MAVVWRGVQRAQTYNAGNSMPASLTRFILLCRRRMVARKVVGLEGRRLYRRRSRCAATPTRLYFIHSDHLNTPRLIIDEQKNVVWRNLPTTEPFGVSAVEDDPNNTGNRFEFNLRFPGQYQDKETNTNYNYFRDYNPGTGRYVQSDPIGLAGGINTYAYVGGSPVRYADPLGLYTEIIIWQPVGHTSSSFGHVSSNLNGTNYSWSPRGWDTNTSAENYARTQDFRSGTGVVLNLTPEQEKRLAACYAKKRPDYGELSNNCGHPHKECLSEVLGENISNSLFPVNIGNDLLESKYYKGSTYYPGPPRKFWDDGFWAR